MGNIFSGHTVENNNIQQSHTLTQQQYEQYKYFMEQQQLQQKKLKQQQDQLNKQNEKLSKIKSHITNHLTTQSKPKQNVNPYQVNTDITPSNSNFTHNNQFETYSNFDRTTVDNTAQYWNQAQQAQQVNQNNQQYQNPQWQTNQYFQKPKNKQRNIKTEEEYKQEFIRKQNKRRKKYEKKLALFDNHEVFDPYKILNVSENYDLSQLKMAYKQAALHTHPDKGGNAKLFKLVTKAYMYLLDKFKNKESKQYVNLKKDFNEYADNQTGNNYGNEKSEIMKQRAINKFSESNGFNNQLFNKIYTDHRLYSINDEGYSKWMKDKKNRVKRQNPIKNSKLFSKNFNIDVFNSVFENLKNTQSESEALIEYREPNALNMMSNNGYTTLGQGKLDDFSSDTGSGIIFSDYKQAHGNSFLINPNAIKQQKRHKSMDHLQKSRSKISYKMSESDKLRYQQLKQEEIERERERVKRLEEQDYMAKQQFESLNQLMLQ